MAQFKDKFLVGRLGDELYGIHIVENNRATVYAYRDKEVRALWDYQGKNYSSKNIKSVIYGIKTKKSIGYAVFCENGFIING